jgi:hypothetical protein
MKTSRDKVDLLRGTLNLLILRALLPHGHQIAKYIQRSADDVLQGRARVAVPGASPDGAQGLEESKWEQVVSAIARVPAQVES